MKTIVLIDIEGTTSSVSFVHDVLFPFARERMHGWLDRHQADPEVAAALAGVAAEAGLDHPSLAELRAVLLSWMEDDLKVGPLKALQGVMWGEGYRSGELRSHVYPDAVAALRRWHARGLPLHVYSSGSVQAQQLFFAHTVAGDLSSWFGEGFDTRVGGKRESLSYHRIASRLGAPPRGICFLSDDVRELDAARHAGLRTVWVVRSGALPDHADHTVVRDLDGFDPAA